MKKRTEQLRKPETVKAIERICDLADAFAEASPDLQREALDALDQEFPGERNRISRDWHTFFTNTFRFAAKETFQNELKSFDEDGNRIMNETPVI